MNHTINLNDIAENLLGDEYTGRAALDISALQSRGVHWQNVENIEDTEASCLNTMPSSADVRRSIENSLKELKG